MGRLADASVGVATVRIAEQRAMTHNDDSGRCLLVLPKTTKAPSVNETVGLWNFCRLLRNDS
jgi:hypothetical protein